MQGTAEEQFAGIAAAACAEALNDVDDILIDEDSVNYSLPKQQPLTPQVQVQNNNQQFLTLMKLTIVHLEVLPTVHWTLLALK